MKAMRYSGILLAVLILGAPAFAVESGSVTLEGKMMCGKCALQLEGLEKCQDVVVTKGEDGERSVFFVVKNDVAEQTGHACQGKRGVTVTGTLAEEDGQTWITPVTIELEVEEES